MNGERFPAELESLRHIVISNGGMSPRLAAARAVRELLALPEAIERAASGQPDLESLLWATWLQARRVALASEKLIDIRPNHEGGCAQIDRPRVMIWGLGNSGQATPVQWFDWTLDGIGIAGGDAIAQAETRLWHGAVQSALETEALMWLTLSEPDIFPPNTGPMVPLTSAANEVAGSEVASDEARGFLTLADATTLPGYWWRLDPATGRADARAQSYGNAIYLLPTNYTNASSGASTSVSGTAQARNTADMARLGSQKFSEEMSRLEDVRQAERNRKKGGGSGYLTILNNVSIPASIALGTTIAATVIGGLLYALYG